MIDQTATTYDHPSVYLPRLVEWAEAAIARHTYAASQQQQVGFASNAEAYIAVAREYRAIAVWARCRLVDISELALDDVDLADAPPAPLVDLTAWLKVKLQADFPLMREDLWQALAYVLRPFRRKA